MGKKVREYKAGDFIFAKVKGYPAWPARVQRMNGKKYFVYFYGTGETANLPPNMIFDYAENKDKFLTKVVKRRDFNDGVKQIEYDFANNVPLEQVVGVLAEAQAATDTANESAANNTVDDSVADSTADNTVSDETVNTTQNDTGIEDSDEADALIIDEGKQKGRKGKADAKGKETPGKPAKEPKTPRGKPKKEDVKEEIKEQEEEIVSRSGRKIRPKRYIDEQTEENATLPTPAAKKRRGASPVQEKEKEKPEVKEKEKDKSPDKNMKSFNALTQSELEDVKDPFKQEYAKKDNILITYLPTGQYIGVKLFQGRPTCFRSEGSRLQWDKQAAANAITLKLQLEKGHITTESVISQLVTDLNLTDEEKATLDRERETEEKRTRVQLLKTEMKLIELDAKIKTCLCLEKADTELCLTLLDELMDLDVKPLMLLKHPTCLETIKRMRAYVGNTHSWELSDSAAQAFFKQAHEIRRQADVLYRGMKDLFITPEGLSFWEFFTERVMQFKKATATLSADELLELVHEPLEMSMPTAHTMMSAILAANEEMPPVNDDDEELVVKKKPTPAKAKKTASNNTPSKQPIKRQSSRKHVEVKPEDAAEESTPDADVKQEPAAKKKAVKDEGVKVEKGSQEKSSETPKEASKTESNKEEAKNTEGEDTTTVPEKSTKVVEEAKVKEEKQETSETRAKRSRDTKKSEPPPLRSPAKRRSKF